MTTEERLEVTQKDSAPKNHRRRWTFWRLVVVVMAAVLTCRIVVSLAWIAVLYVSGQQRLVNLEALSDPAWWSGRLGEFIGMGVGSGALLVVSFLVLRRNALKWRAGTYTFGTVVRLIIFAPIFLVASLSVVAYAFGFFLGDLLLALAEVIWKAP